MSFGERATSALRRRSLSSVSTENRFALIADGGFDRSPLRLLPLPHGSESSSEDRSFFSADPQNPVFGGRGSAADHFFDGPGVVDQSEVLGASASGRRDGGGRIDDPLRASSAGGPRSSRGGHPLLGRRRSNRRATRRRPHSRAEQEPLGNPNRWEQWPSRERGSSLKNAADPFA